MAGPAGLVAKLDRSSVTLQPGQSEAVSITTETVNFALSGGLFFAVSAQSRAASAVQAAASGQLLIPTTVGLTAAFTPDKKLIPVPGTTDFLLTVNNTGNTEDAYNATIISSTGPVSASLVGLDGQLTNPFSTFRLPALSSGAILLRANQLQPGTASVRVMVQSLTNDFFAFEGSFRNGTSVSIGDFDGDGFLDLAFGAEAGGGPRVRVINGLLLLTMPNLEDLDSAVLQNRSLQLCDFFSSSPEYRGGARVALRDQLGTGQTALVIGSGVNEPARVRIYRSNRTLVPELTQELKVFKDTPIRRPPTRRNRSALTSGCCSRKVRHRLAPRVSKYQLLLRGDSNGSRYFSPGWRLK